MSIIVKKYHRYGDAAEIRQLILIAVAVQEEQDRVAAAVVDHLGVAGAAGLVGEPAARFAVGNEVRPRKAVKAGIGVFVSGFLILRGKELDHIGKGGLVAGGGDLIGGGLGLFPGGAGIHGAVLGDGGVHVVGHVGDQVVVVADRVVVGALLLIREGILPGFREMLAVIGGPVGLIQQTAQTILRDPLPVQGAEIGLEIRVIIGGGAGAQGIDGAVDLRLLLWYYKKIATLC